MRGLLNESLAYASAVQMMIVSKQCSATHPIGGSNGGKHHEQA